MFIINHTLEIEAPKEIVWQVLTDVARYEEWNSYVIRCETTFEVGSKILLEVQNSPGKITKAKETIYAHIPGALISYGLKLPLGMLMSTRQHILSSSQAGHTQYESCFELKGWLSPIVKLTMGQPLENGFSRMSNELKVQAVKLANEISSE